MIISKNIQGTDQWKNDRLGKFTASNFSKIMSPLKFLKSKDAYFYKIASERLTGEPYFAEVTEEEYVSSAMQRGNNLEMDAVREYQFINNCMVERVGFCQPEIDSLYGCSPDGLVNDDGGIEIKTPQLFTHLKYVEDNIIPSEYLSQVYGSLFVTGRLWWDFFSFNPNFNPLCIRVYSTSDKYQAWVAKFKPILAGLIEKLKTYKPIKESN